MSGPGGRVWRFGDDIDTDVLAPGLYMKKPIAELASHCLEAVDPNFAPAHYYVGMHLGKKDKKKALEHLDKAAALAKGEGVGPAAKREADELRKKK